MPLRWRLEPARERAGGVGEDYGAGDVGHFFGGGWDEMRAAVVVVEVDGKGRGWVLWVGCRLEGG